MPRIDPQQLLTCLSILISPSGGILSKDVVQRLANLMTKFSKKLVSKCVYVLILKNTDQQLLDSFMAEGGWSLVSTWIQDAFQNKNWALVTELLELLLLTPVDVERLKSNSLPKLVKILSRREDLEGIHELASQLVQLWLKIVKDQTQQDANQAETRVVTLVPPEAEHVTVVQLSKPIETTTKIIQVNDDNQTDCYKLAVRDGKHILCKVSPSEANVTLVTNAVIEEVKAEDLKDELDEIKKDDKSKENKDRSNKDRDRKKSSSSSSNNKSSSRDREKSGSSSKSRDKDKSSSSSSSSRSKDRRDRDKHRSNGSLKSSSSSKSSSSNNSRDKKESKEKQAEKDKDTLAKIQPQSLNKLGRIPKKSSDERSKEEEKRRQDKKASMGIETKNPNEPRPKTVKVYNSKMRSTGLLEEAKPPPPRPVKKATPTTLPANISLKRSSPVRELIPPPEKKPKIDLPERPGSIKLIPPKPKPSVLLESDIFMDALNASASSKKEPKKRKRRPSVNKESTSSPPQSPSTTTPPPLSSTTTTTLPSSPTPTSPTTATNSLNIKAITPANFYQDTLEEKTEEKPDETMDVDDENVETKTIDNETIATESDDVKDIDDDSDIKNENKGLKGVLLYHKKKGPKRSIRWKQDSELVTVQYFELDETERVNVTRAFMDLAKMEMSGEREALQKSRKLINEDVMDIQTNWRCLIEIDLKTSLVESGGKSLEKDIQFAREKTVLQALYFGGKMAPESAIEPDPENHQMTDHVIIPLEDPENPDVEAVPPPWPEPKGSPPPAPIQNIPQLFTGTFPTFSLGAPPPNFQNVPFGTPNPNFLPTNLLAPNNDNWNNGPRMPHNMPPPDLMNQNNPLPAPGLFPNTDFNQNMNDNNFAPPFNQNPGIGMFPNNFHMNRGGGGGGGGGGGSGGSGGGGGGGGGGVRGGFRGRGMVNGPWLRMNGPGPGPGWNSNRGGGGNMNRGGRICKNIKNHGYCRNRDNCHFYHPN